MSTDPPPPFNAQVAEMPTVSMKAGTRAVATGGIGNAAEWYELVMYAVLVPVFAGHFFPSQDQLYVIFGCTVTFILIKHVKETTWEPLAR